jgi:hypothetical protein
MPRKPTGKRGGRHPGSKNKATIERELIASRELAAREAELAQGEARILAARRAGQKLAKEVLEDLMNLGMGMVGTYQPYPPNQRQNPNYDDDKFWRAADFTRECAAALANYQSPKYKAVAIMATPAPKEADRSVPGGKVIGKIGNPMLVYQRMIGQVVG